MSGKIDGLRREVEAIDDELLLVLQRRARIVERIAKEKQLASIPIYDPVREEALIERARSRLREAHPATFFAYVATIAQMRRWAVAEYEAHEG